MRKEKAKAKKMKKEKMEAELEEGRWAKWKEEEISSFFFLYPFPEFSNVGKRWDRRKFYDVRFVFPEIGIFSSSWDAANFVAR
jgi:hypothetical protein